MSLEFAIARLLHESKNEKRIRHVLMVAKIHCYHLAKATMTIQLPSQLKLRKKVTAITVVYRDIGPETVANPRKRNLKQSQLIQQKNKKGLFSATVEHAAFYSKDTGNSNDMTWYIGPGASQHMCPDKELTVDLVKFSSPEKVHLGDNRVVEAPGKGNLLANVKVGGCREPVQLHKAIFRNGCVILDDEGTTITTGKF